ncbi:dethiobiotin synthase, partial [Escherichia coli]|nr:dethiobiotin synthase [Escherichia coli]
YKPVEAGSVDIGGRCLIYDALHLQDAATLDVAYDDVNPYALELPASPHIAAKHEHVEISYDVLSQKLAQHKQQADVVLVEGAGGWRVPVSDTDCLSTWV